MGKNKLSKFADLESYEHVIQVPFSAVMNADHELKGNWSQKMFGNNNPIVLELGCGKGEYTVNLARKYPEKNFIGVDIKGSRMWKGAKESKLEGIKNVAFLRTNIEGIDRFFAEGEVEDIWLTFPDPQMKKTSRRLTSTFFMERYRRFLKTDGVVHLKCDSNFQYEYTKAMVEENKFEVIQNTDNLYESNLVDEILQIKTYYEKQWLDRGITIKYISFKLHQGELTEPDVEIEKDSYRSFGRSAKDL
ncbi:tRNA (guanosine(46)-N7)-methyltransferase TrmB [Prolixibacteraceae bacterium JC049]|nr:tRNA (guanosine(46)-N7)-methyltransferase TrmB [Prolixibacteraceae bacterium JC049]